MGVVVGVFVGFYWLYGKELKISIGKRNCVDWMGFVGIGK